MYAKLLNFFNVALCSFLICAFAFKSNVMVAVATKFFDNPVSQIRLVTDVVSDITVTGCHGS